MKPDLSKTRLPRNEGAENLKSLQLELMLSQQDLYSKGRRAVIVVEGMDAAGKGGAIRRTLRYMDPRGYTVCSIGPPNQQELGEHYLQRFWRRLPAQGMIALFDRSWYGRVLVERVDGLIEKPVWQRAYSEINAFEKMLVDDGIILIKILMHIGKKEQHRRLVERLITPEKQWKLTSADLRSHEFWDENQKAIKDAIEKTHTERAPWVVIPADGKTAARQQFLQVIKNRLDEELGNNHYPIIDDELRRQAVKVLGLE